jgi:ThiF family
MSFTKKKSRIELAFLGSGKFDFDQTQHQLQDVHLRVHLAADVAESATGQAALLTTIALAGRCFGRISVAGAAGVPYRAAFPLDADTLEEAAGCLGAVSAEDTPTHSLVVGSDKVHGVASVAVRATWENWVAAVSPADEDATPCTGSISLAAVAAAALAVGELFQQRLKNPLAGRRSQKISLWGADAAEPGPTSPEALQLPRDIWLVGLGNLGQAFLWALASLNYRHPQEVALVLQDFDRVDEENFGTSILTGPEDAGKLKTYIAEQWCLQRGFSVNRIDRPLDERTVVAHQEPRLAFSGLDKISVRKLLGSRGFQYVIDAGLGSNAGDFDRFRINTFDETFQPAAHFEGQEDADESARADAFLVASQTYKEAVDSASPEEACGLLAVAGKSVAVPYVSSLAACLVVAQAIRLVNGYATYKSMVGQLRNLDGVRAHLGNKAGRLVVGSTPHGGDKT